MIDLKKFRRDLHQIPELGFEEFKTQAYILNALDGLDCKIETVGTGTILYFDTNSPRTIAFRADIDALPIEEETGLGFASRHPGKMHACGHDGHTSILLGLAHFLNENKQTLNKNIVLVFQQSEEKETGAKTVIDSGILQKYNPEAIFGLHLWPGFKKNSIWTRAGEFMATSNELNVHIIGRASHVANSELGIDSIAAACDFLTAAYDMEKQLQSEVFRLLKFGKIEAGTARNIIAGEAIINGTIRSFDEKIHDELKAGIIRIAGTVDDKFKTRTVISYEGAYDAVLNDATVLGKVKTFAPFINELVDPVLQGEDFGLYRGVCPILFFFLGVGDVAPLHNEKFDFDMDVLDTGLNLFKEIVLNY